MSQNSTTTFSPTIGSMSGISISQFCSSLVGLMFALAMLKQCCPDFIRDYFQSLFTNIASVFRSNIQIAFYEFDTYSYMTSDAYLAIKAYIGILSMKDSNNATRFKGDKANEKSSTASLVFVLDDNEKITETFEGVKFTWFLGRISPNRKSVSYSPWSAEKGYFMLTCKKKHRRFAMDKYLTHVIEEGESIIKTRRTRMLFTNNPSKDWSDYSRGMWRTCVFEHSASFENLAIDPVKKDEIIEDLMTFTKARDYYKKIGKAWKRGYLLYGPPGTGKTTMIACMANLLAYDVYDLELTTVKNNSELRNLLISTTGKSIILIEDIDCTLPITSKRQSSDDTDKKQEDSEKESDESPDSKKKPGSDSEADDGKSKVTLSGLLNIIDGLWSPCSEERIIVFTTNHIEKLDPALIRTGRMDKHIEMSYCTFEAFKIFAMNYLSIGSHPLFNRIETLLSEVNIGPSDVAENLLPKSRNEDPERRLEAVIQALEERKNEREKSVKLEENKPADE